MSYPFCRANEIGRRQCSDYQSTSLEALQRSLDAVNRVKEAVSSQITTELLAYELRNAIEYLGEISGEFTNDEVLGNIFSKFCIGK